MNFFDIWLGVTSLCNLNCEYCFESNKLSKYHMDDKDVNRVIEFINFILVDKEIMNNYNGIRITFFGGEPTICDNHLQTIYNAFKDNPHVFFILITNGLLLNKLYNTLLNSVNNKRFKVQISYDGDKITQLFRNTSSELIFKEINFMYQNDIPFSIKSTLPLNALEYIYESYLDFVEFNQQFPKKNIKYNYTLDLYNDNNIIIDYKKLKINLVNILINEYNRYQTGLHLIFFQQLFDRQINLCAAGRKQFFISFDKGDIYTCSYDETINKKLSISNIFNNMNTILNDIKTTIQFYTTIKQKIECNKCLISLCPGCTSKLLFNPSENGIYNDNVCSVYQLIARAAFIFKIIIQENDMFNEITQESQTISKNDIDALKEKLQAVKIKLIDDNNFIDKINVLEDHMKNIVIQIKNCKKI